jgi:hypothetical protein
MGRSPDERSDIRDNSNIVPGYRFRSSGLLDTCFVLRKREANALLRIGSR